MKNFWRIFYVVCAVSTLVLIFIVVSLFKGDQITYTNLDESSGTIAPSIQSYSPILGNNKNPSVIIFSYSNYSCPTCKSVDALLTELAGKAPEVAIIWKDFPNSSLYPESISAAIAGRCALQQKKFWEFHDRLFANQSTLGRDTYLEIAKTLELNENKFAKCFDGQKTISYVNADQQEGVDLGILTAPTIIVNGQMHTGPLRSQELELMVSRALEDLASE